MIYEHLHVDGLRLFTLVKGRFMLMDDSDELERPGTRSLIRGTAVAAAVIAGQNKRMILQMSAAQRGRSRGPSSQHDRQGREGTAEHTTCWSRGNRTAHYGMKERANQSLHTLENIRRVPTQVT